MAIAGIDIGTQSLKVVITDHALRILGEATQAYSVAFPQPGWAQQDPADWERSLAPVMAEALARASLRPADVEALGVSGQLDGCLGVDASGAAVTPCLIWMDRRATDKVPRALLGGGAAGFRQTTGLVADATHMAAKIAWIKDRAQGGHGAVRFHQPVSYLVERLTGAYVFDHGLASTTMLYSLASRAYDPELLALFGISERELPAISGAAEQAGTLSAEGARLCGLVPGTPVAVGTGDDFATPLGAGLIKPGEVACVIGTAEVVGALCERAALDAGGLVETHGYVNELFFIENPGWLSGGAMAWLSGLVGEGFAALDDSAAAVPAGCDGLVFLPALSGAMAPEWIAEARGCFYGLTPGHGRPHMARAVMEGCAFAMRDVVTRLGELGVAARSIMILGGGSRSRLWGQMRADMTGLPVWLSSRTDTCPLGAAMLAAAASGIVASLGECARLVAGERVLLSPEPSQRDVYDAGYARYRLLFESLRPLYTTWPPERAGA